MVVIDWAQMFSVLQVCHLETNLIEGKHYSHKFIPGTKLLISVGKTSKLFALSLTHSGKLFDNFSIKPVLF